MARVHLSLRLAGPVLIVSVLLLALCITAAVALYYLQAASADVLGENVSSSQIAHELETTLNNLITLPRAQSEQIDALLARAREQLEQAEGLADKEQERQYVNQLRAEFESALARWEARQKPGADLELAKTEGIGLLKTEPLRLCRELQKFNTQQARLTEASHRRTGLCGIAGLSGSRWW